MVGLPWYIHCKVTVEGLDNARYGSVFLIIWGSFGQKREPSSMVEVIVHPLLMIRLDRVASKVLFFRSGNEVLCWHHRVEIKADLERITRSYCDLVHLKPQVGAFPWTFLTPTTSTLFLIERKFFFLFIHSSSSFFLFFFRKKKKKK